MFVDEHTVIIPRLLRDPGLSESAAGVNSGSSERSESDSELLRPGLSPWPVRLRV